MKTRFINYLYFSHNERLGAFALFFVCIAAFSTPSILQWLRPQTKTDFSEFEATIQAFRQSASGAESGVANCFDFDPNLSTEADFRKLGLSEKVAKNICNYLEKGGSFRKPEDFKKIWSLASEDYERLLPYIHISVGKNRDEVSMFSPDNPEHFPFDPNTVSEADLFRLGLPDRTVKSILNYRAKGGVFRKKEDLAKIYTLSEADFQRLEPFITFPENALRPNAFAAGSYKSSTSKGPIDINRADVEAWMSLPLIGERRAQQIVNFREKLGGFRAIDQLAEMYGLPDSVFQRIRPQLTLDTKTIHPINLNTASVEGLDAHPYISRKQAELIIAYRAQHGNFEGVEDVLKIKAFTDKAWWDKVSPYLATE